MNKGGHSVECGRQHLLLKLRNKDSLLACELRELRIQDRQKDTHESGFAIRQELEFTIQIEFLARPPQKLLGKAQLAQNRSRFRTP